MTTYTLPPGKYYIGDPCYVLDDDAWDRVLELSSCFEDGKPVPFDDHMIWAHHTMYGDGAYYDQNGNEFGVDSGCLGAVPLSAISDPAGEDSGALVDAPNGLVVEYDEQTGTFVFGSIIIKTGDEDIEDGDFDGGYDGDPDKDHFL